ncbi:MAG: hypothetical protein M1829_001976 [Trizodia sp. TS-e1964]|nr:MAG: hypothetical protein M1829_001976 [Trizodia sp. TS-e1964]
MSVQILSDLHLESPKAYDVFEIKPSAPHLALLGDIGNVVAHQDECLAFLTRQLSRFRAVLFIPGNHEAYGSSWRDTLDALRNFEQAVRADASLGDFVLLDRGAYRVPSAHANIVVLGCSLFSHIPAAREMAVSVGLNDFYATADWSVGAHNAAHRRDLTWLNAQVAALELEESDARVMVLTHWSPSRDPRAIDPRHGTSSITSAFSTDLSGEKCFQSDKVKCWAFGHTHYNCDFTVERGGAGAPPLRLLANQRGYYFSQAGGFDEGKVVDLSAATDSPVDILHT